MPLSWEEKHGSQFLKKTGLFPTDSTLFCHQHNKCNGCYTCNVKKCYFWFTVLFFTTSENALTCKSLESALQLLQIPPYLDQIENIWIIGGASVYRVYILL